MAIAMDPFQRDDYMTSYVVNALTQEDVPDAVMTQAEKWAVKLEKVDSNSTPLYLAQAYFQRGETDKAYGHAGEVCDLSPPRRPPGMTPSCCCSSILMTARSLWTTSWPSSSG